MVNTIAGFSGKLIHPSDPDYNAARRTWNSMMDKRPSVIAQCRTTGDVVAALRHALRERLEIAVRAGGHSVAGLSRTNGGMTIDLQDMSRVVVEPSAQSARVGVVPCFARSIARRTSTAWPRRAAWFITPASQD